MCVCVSACLCACVRAYVRVKKDRQTDRQTMNVLLFVIVKFLSVVIFDYVMNSPRSACTSLYARRKDIRDPHDLTRNL